jgi:hypothetical protein
MLRATCCVIVLAPCTTPPASTLRTAARTTPLKSRPWCSKNDASSAARNASCSVCGTRDSGMITRRSTKNSPITEPSAP